MYRIDGISAGQGGRIILKLTLPRGATEILAIDAEAFRRLDVRKGEISHEEYKSLAEESERGAALAKGLRILAYGANSPRQLKDKLCRAGVSRERAESVARELSEKGYLKENEDAVRMAESMLERGWGLKRIISALRTKGYSDEACEAAVESLSDVDFAERCTAVAKKRLKNLSPDRAEVQKAIAKLVNLGYNVSEAKKAVSAVLSERGEN